jgi:hypothetical protein
MRIPSGPKPRGRALPIYAPDKIPLNLSSLTNPFPKRKAPA